MVFALALVLLFVYATLGYLSSRPSEGANRMTDTMREANALVIAVIAVIVVIVGAVAWVTATVIGIMAGVTPFLYAVGDEIYPYAKVYGIACLVTGSLVVVLTWTLLRRGAQARQLPSVD